MDASFYVVVIDKVHNGVYGLLRLMLGIILENVVFSCIVYDFGMITNVIFQYTIIVLYHQP